MSHHPHAWHEVDREVDKLCLHISYLHIYNVTTYGCIRQHIGACHTISICALALVALPMVPHFCTGIACIL